MWGFRFDFASKGKPTITAHYRHGAVTLKRQKSRYWAWGGPVSMRQIDIVLTVYFPAGMKALRMAICMWRSTAGTGLRRCRCWTGSPGRSSTGCCPSSSGLELCRRLRCDAQTEAAHITMVLEEDDAETKRRALRAGADDYIIGPIDRAAVLDRVLSVQLPEREAPARLLRLGDLALDLAALQARWRTGPSI